MLTVAGLIPFTTIDFPGKLAAVIFLQGCPLRCPFCHNRALQIEGTPTDIGWPEIDVFLANRRRQLDGIVLSGGEPLKNPQVLDLITQIKNQGYQVGVHTSGVYPDILERALPSLDWVGLDIKAPWDKYALLTGRGQVAPLVQKSLDLLLQSGKAFETRTTCDPRYLSRADIATIGRDLSGRGVRCYVLQKYRTFEGDSNPPEESAIASFFRDTELLAELRVLFPQFGTR